MALNESYKYGKSGEVETLEFAEGLVTTLHKNADTRQYVTFGKITGDGDVFIKNFIKKK